MLQSKGRQAPVGRYAYGLVAVAGRPTSRCVWGASPAPRALRLRQGFLAMASFTTPVLLAFAAYGAGDAYAARGD